MIESGAAGTTVATAPVESLRAAAVPDATPGDTSGSRLRPGRSGRATRDPPPLSVNRVEGEVREIGYLGDFSVYKVRLADGFVINAMPRPPT